MYSSYVFPAYRIRIIIWRSVRILVKASATIFNPNNARLIESEQTAVYLFFVGSRVNFFLVKFSVYSFNYWMCLSTERVFKWSVKVKSWKENEHEIRSFFFICHRVLTIFFCWVGHYFPVYRTIPELLLYHYHLFGSWPGSWSWYLRIGRWGFNQQKWGLVIQEIEK